MSHMDPAAGNGADHETGGYTAGSEDGNGPQAASAAAGAEEAAGTGPDGGGHSSAGDRAGVQALWIRLLYMVGFGFIGWVTFWVLVVLALLQFVATLISHEMNKDLTDFNRNLSQYLWEIVSFVTMVRDEKPFPFGPFPKVDEPEL